MIYARPEVFPKIKPGRPSHIALPKARSDLKLWLGIAGQGGGGLLFWVRSGLPDRSPDWRSVTRPFLSRMCKDYIQKLSQRQTPSKSSLGSLLGTLVTLLEPLGSLLGAPWAHLTFQNEAQKLLKSALEDLLDPLGCLLRPCWKNIKKNLFFGPQLGSQNAVKNK